MHGGGGCVVAMVVSLVVVAKVGFSCVDICFEFFYGFLCMVVVGWVVAMVVYLMGFLGGWLLVANLGLIFSYGFDFVLWV